MTPENRIVIYLAIDELAKQMAAEEDETGLTIILENLTDNGILNVFYARLNHYREIHAWNYAFEEYTTEEFPEGISLSDDE